MKTLKIKQVSIDKFFVGYDTEEGLFIVVGEAQTEEGAGETLRSLSL